jgi:DNA-binding CsgD family transcriptional regulator
MQGEFIATQAVVAATMGRPLEVCMSFADRARAVTTCVEARAYTACATAIALQRAGMSQTEIIDGIRGVGRLGVWDAIVSTVRAAPEVLMMIAQADEVDPLLIRTLRNSTDHDLARKAGIDLGRRVTSGSRNSILSRREREVLELIRQGLTNREIAKALFLSQATVKVHVRHILEKTGSRTRTEAATSVEFER